jgi:large subunit ribosomal protein L9
MATRLEAVTVTIASKVHEADKLYGSVTVRDIIDALQKQDVEVEKRMVLLTEPIKTIGTFKVPIRVYQGVEPEITVEVVPEVA